MIKKSLGLIETEGFVPAIEAADVGVKAANVSLLGCELTWPARLTVIFQGDVGAVKAAVTAGTVAADKIGEVISSHVIPRPNSQFQDFQTGSPFPFIKTYAVEPSDIEVEPEETIEVPQVEKKKEDKSVKTAKPEEVKETKKAVDPKSRKIEEITPPVLPDKVETKSKTVEKTDIADKETAKDVEKVVTTVETKVEQSAPVNAKTDRGEKKKESFNVSATVEKALPAKDKSVADGSSKYNQKTVPTPPARKTPATKPVRKRSRKK